ncbi:MAG: HAMP domain-containing histidine kinase [Peptococcaceae bacterium]|jgi:signal transduction histidine kinase|nr:HAMP domain-containing histidine kinase [Peptococcaceae bacterium]
MIRKLRLKFITVTIVLLLLVFASVLVTLNAFMWTVSTRQTERLLAMVIAQDGIVLPPRNGPWEETANPLGWNLQPEMMRAGRFFYVKLDHAGNIFETHYEMMFDFSGGDVAQYALDTLDKNREKGIIDSFQYAVAEKDYGKIMVFAERSIETLMLTQLIRVSLWVAGGVCLVSFIFSLFFSKWAVFPLKAAFERQRRFVSDASHELKTPLTILNANADVLESEIGANERLDNIKTQSKRMQLLIHDLLTLAKADDAGFRSVFSEFDLSGAVLSTALEFESRAFEENKKYAVEAAAGIVYCGDAGQIRRLVAILIDNAINHSAKNGIIRVSLARGGGHPVISIYNTGAGISESEREKVFDRFYRSDESRSRDTGGYGLGLSIAKSIVEAHQGKITVDGKAGEWVRFSVTL